MADEKDIIELLDDDDDLITLVDDEGNELYFNHVTDLEYEGKLYACLQSAVMDDSNSEEQDDVLEIFEISVTEENGEKIDNYISIDDDLYDILFDKCLELIDEAYEASEEEEEGDGTIDGKPHKE